MICPNCKADSISFLPIWLKGSFGSQTCGQCQTKIKLKRTPAVVISSLLLGLAIGLAPFAISYVTNAELLSWRTFTTFLVVLLILLAVDAVKDYFLVELETASAKPV